MYTQWANCMDCALYFNKAVNKKNEQKWKEGKKSLSTILNGKYNSFQTKKNGLFSKSSQRKFRKPYVWKSQIAVNTISYPKSSTTYLQYWRHSPKYTENNGEEGLVKS